MVKSLYVVARVKIVTRPKITNRCNMFYVTFVCFDAVLLTFHLVISRPISNDLRVAQLI